jgi:hypothetical protein
MKQITLAMHVYHEAFNSLPPRYNATQENREYNPENAPNAEDSPNERPDGYSDTGIDKSYRWSPNYVLLPFIEQSARFYELRTNCVSPRTITDSNRSFLTSALSAVLCPSAPPCPNEPFAIGNIVYSYGDGAVALDYDAHWYALRHPDERGGDVYGLYNSPYDGWSSFDVFSRGLFYFNIPKGFNDITDGLSNTIAVSEAVVNDEPGVPKVKGGIAYHAITRTPAIIAGTEWLWSPARAQTLPISGKYFIVDGESLTANERNGEKTLGGRCCNCLDSASISCGFNTILPPNEISVTPVWADPATGFFPPNSGHTGGVNCGLADGSVHFVTDNVDTGGLPDAPQGMYLDTPRSYHPNLDYAPASPYGVWGAMGTPSAGEVVALP